MHPQRLAVITSDSACSMEGKDLPRRRRNPRTVGIGSAQGSCSTELPSGYNLQMSANLQHLFNSSGNWIAYRMGRFVFSKSGEWIGWLPWDDEYVVNTRGQYLGTI